MLKRIIKEHEEHKNGPDTNSQGKVDHKPTLSLESLKHLKIAYIPYNELIKEGFLAGLGWAFGVTIGFVIISTIIVVVLRALGGLPLIGSFFADVVEETQAQLLRRTPLFNQ
jgi:hypothetical protein